jgi:hypothetical protein
MTTVPLGTVHTTADIDVHMLARGITQLICEIALTTVRGPLDLPVSNRR